MTFDDCLAAADETVRFFCLVDALADEVIEVCDAGWTNSGA